MALNNGEQPRISEMLDSPASPLWPDSVIIPLDHSGAERITVSDFETANDLIAGLWSQIIGSGLFELRSKLDGASSRVRLSNILDKIRPRISLIFDAQMGQTFIQSDHATTRMFLKIWQAQESGTFLRNCSDCGSVYRAPGRKRSTYCSGRCRGRSVQRDRRARLKRESN